MTYNVFGGTLTLLNSTRSFPKVGQWRWWQHLLVTWWTSAVSVTIYIIARLSPSEQSCTVLDCTGLAKILFTFRTYFV